MNLLLLEPDEVDDAGGAVLRGRRARHLLEVLAVRPGRRLRAGIVDGPRGHAEVVATGADLVRVRVACGEAAPPADDVLLLAVPRPKVLLRVLALAAACGFGRIVLFRSWRVDRSHLGSRALDPGVQRAHLLAGLEQARRTRLPRVQCFARFRPFVEDALPVLPLPAHRFCAHPAAAAATGELAGLHAAAFALALGPEGGLLPYEVDRLAECGGFLPVRLGAHPLRTEAALAALWGQLDLLRHRQ